MVRQLQGREKRGAGAVGAAGGARGDPPRLPGEDPGGEPPVCCGIGTTCCLAVSTWGLPSGGTLREG